MIEFIFMLTRDDVTLEDAREVYASVAGSGLRHVGCKDVGLPREELQAFMDEIRPTVTRRGWRSSRRPRRPRSSRPAWPRRSAPTT